MLPTSEEEKKYGCSHHSGCCVNAYQCMSCSTRFTFKLEAPEMDNE
jgi:hypothetical protein